MYYELNWVFQPGLKSALGSTSQDLGQDQSRIAYGPEVLTETYRGELPLSKL